MTFKQINCCLVSKDRQKVYFGCKSGFLIECNLSRDNFEIVREHRTQTDITAICFAGKDDELKIVCG